jgi:hypothetical protein
MPIGCVISIIPIACGTSTRNGRPSEASRRVVNQSKISGTGANRCCVLNFTPAKGFSAALAVEGEDFQLDWHRWL